MCGLKNKRFKKGIILLWVLIIAFVFSLVFLGLYPKLHLWSSVTNKIYDETYTNWYFYSAQEFAKKILMESAYTNVNSPNQVWARDDLEYRFSDTNYFTISIKDEDGKLPLNNVFSRDLLNPISETYQRIFSRLLKIAKFPNELNDLFKLWEERIKIYQTKVNLLTFEEFISFPQFQYKYIFNNEFVPLSDFVTVYSTGKINVNTIRKEVFLSLSDNITEKAYDLLQDIVKNSSTGIKNVSDISQYSEFEPFYNSIKDFLTVESLYFVVEVRIFYEGTVTTKRFLFSKNVDGKKIRFYKIAEIPQYQLQITPNDKLKWQKLPQEND